MSNKNKSAKDSEGYYTYSVDIDFDKNTINAGKNRVWLGCGIDGAYNFHIDYSVSVENYVPTKSSIQCIRTVPNMNYDRKAQIVATYTDNNTNSKNYLDMILAEIDEETGVIKSLSSYSRATRTGDTYTCTFDLVAEIREPKNVYVKVKDASGNETILEDGAVQVQYIDAVAPTLTSALKSSTQWSKNKQITYIATDRGIGQVQIGFNSEDNYTLATQDGDNYSKTYNFVGDVYGNANAALYLQDGLGNNTMKRVTISNIDNTAPTILNVNKALNTNRNNVQLSVTANDYNNTINKEGSGITGYAITTTNTAPGLSNFQESNTFTVTNNGTYYIWAKDLVGNISQARVVTVDDLEITISGNITWNDSNNRYNSRKTTTINLYRKIQNGTEQKATSTTITAGQTQYSFKVDKTDSNGNTYIYRIEQEQILGYETTYSNNNITNTLILPTYTSNITYTPVNSLQNRYLKNGEVKLVGEITANSSNRDLSGLNSGIATFTIDSSIEISSSKITIKFYEKSTNTTHNITDYTLSGNVLTVNFGKTISGISQKGDKLTIEIQGKLGKIGTYTSNIKLVGNLLDYRGTSTTINLGEITNTTKTIEASHQLPKANIQIEKRDSITEEKLTDVTFTLYEWNGTKYIEKETIIDANKDGIYVSSLYEWNTTTEGKYKIVETGVSPRHKDLHFSMEFTINQLKGENYTIRPDYTNSEYIINYGIRRPDDFDSINGIVENEPWKLKATIEKIDSQTGNVIQSETQFTIYEWNKENSIYEEYISYTTGQKVNMIRQADKTYITGEWLYYTPKNEGKYRIIETISPNGYYANYQSNGEKTVYDINIIDAITSGTYKNQTVSNESILKVGNNTQNKMTNERVNATLNINIVDKETKGDSQTDSKIIGAKYGVYAQEQINHADGITTRYQGEPGILYKKDELIQTQLTDNLGKMIFNNLECGKYYIKMMEAPIGYKLDDTKYQIDFSYQGENIRHLEKTQNIEIQVKKQAFQLYKINENEETLCNAGFSIYLISDLSIVKTGKITRVGKDTYRLNDEQAKNSIQLNGKENEDGTYYLTDLIEYYYKIRYTEDDMSTLPGDEQVYHPYDLSEERYVKDYKNSVQGIDIEEIRTDDNGYMKSPELAYGEYIVLETSVPRRQKAIKSFIIKIEEDGRNPQTLRSVIDKDFKTRLKIYIKDATTKNIINKTSYYVIKNEETQKIITYTKDGIEQGTLENPFALGNEEYFITPMELPIGRYILEEVTAPVGYVINGKEGYAEGKELKNKPREKVRFEIASNAVLFMDNYLDAFVIVIEKENEAVLGTITIKAQGEYLVKAQKQDDNYQLTYKNKPIPNVEYDIYAKEDIYTQDNKNILLHRKDEKISSVITNANGEITINNLQQGKYYIRETKSGYGFALNKEIKDVEIEYQGQNVPVVFKEILLNEVRQSIEITIKNVNNETKEKLQGGIYELYTKEEIIYQNENGETETIPANTLICITQSNENGEIKFNKEHNIDLPLGNYVVKEKMPPKGYIKSEDINIIADTTGGEEKIIINKTLEKEKTKIYIENIGEGEKITGATIVIQDEEGNIITRIDSLQELNEIRGFEIEKQYIIKVENPSSGYVTNEDISFMLDKAGNLQIDEKYLDIDRKNTIKITSEKTKLDIKFKYGEEIIKGIEFSIKEKETQKVIASTNKQENVLLIQDKENNYYVEGIPIGEYILIEENIPYNLGYVEKQEKEIQIRDTKEEQIVEVEQEVSKLLLQVTDKDTKEKVSNVSIQIQDNLGNIIASTKEQEVKDIIKKENILKIEEIKDGYYVEKLPVGEYTILKITKDGYKDIESVKIRVGDITERQKVLLETRKLIFNVGIEKKLENIIINGENKKVKNTDDIIKLEIKEKEISTIDVKLQYVIKVSNLGEVDATVEKILDKIPNGLNFIKEESGNWNVEQQNAVYEELINLKPGEYKEIPITLKWENSTLNFGKKENTAELSKVSNKYGYKNSNESNGNKNSVTVFISITTGPNENITISQIIITTVIINIIFLAIILILIKKKNNLVGA